MNGREGECIQDFDEKTGGDHYEDRSKGKCKVVPVLN
jgi:hypothetical protein